jgi:hypothetical protein
MRSAWPERSAFVLLAAVIVALLLGRVLFDSGGALLDPASLFARNAIRRGEFPLWANGIVSGTPFFATLRTSVLSPFSLLGYLVPLRLAPALLAGLPPIVGGLGMFIFIRGCRLSFTAAAMCGVAFLVAMFIAGWTGTSAWAGAAWLPWALVGADRCLAATHRRNVAWVAGTTAVIALSGDMRSLFAILLASAFVVYQAERASSRWRTFPIILIGIVLGILAGGVQLLPFLEYVSLGGRDASRPMMMDRQVPLTPPPSIEVVNGDRDLFRIAEWGRTSIPNSGLVFGVQDLLGSDIGGIRWYRELLDGARHANGSTSGAGESILPNHLLDLLNVKYVLSARPIADDHFTLVSSGEDVRVYRNKGALPRVFLADSYVVLPDDEALRAISTRRFNLRWTAILDRMPSSSPLQSTSGGATDAPIVRHYGNDDVTIDTTSSGARVLVFTDPYYPGWEATLDGRPVPIYRADYAFRAISLPDGRHIVEFHYRPRSFTYGLLLSLVAGVLLALLAMSRPTVGL